MIFKIEEGTSVTRISPVDLDEMYYNIKPEVVDKFKSCGFIRVKKRKSIITIIDTARMDLFKEELSEKAYKELKFYHRKDIIKKLKR